MSLSGQQRKKIQEVRCNFCVYIATKAEVFINFINDCNQVLVGKILSGIGVPNYYLKDGTKITAIKITAINSRKYFLNRNLLIECPSCGYRWNFYGESNPIKFLEVKETHRLTENFGTDERLIDNSKSISKITRIFTVSREWSKSYSIQYEKTQINGIELNLGLKFSEVEFGSIKKTSQETLQKAYSISEEKKETYTEQVQIDIPEHKKVKVIFSWKYIWQCGLIKFGYQNNTGFDVPFKVAVGVTFDQLQTDE